ncbi:hypothetical protein [Streptomyces griseocarneus]|uniref:hypothetical protein n=1 Tax=Streptomyces griseocarneus TaxID=51201 RepID=UPI00167D6E21|nr:hypothetical protein [Streptomyces griseocarneus]MBZ6476971.1 hypothetical protein [Streptomyces griseocarneus]GHG76414.1 hypothetical protein GCM10018779_54710 [Streptomyces griseocarneus]
MNIRSAWLLNTTDAAGGQSRIDTRLAPLGAMTPGGAMTSLDGVLPGSANGTTTISGLRVYGDTAGLSAKVAPGRAVVQGSEAAGAYPVYVPEVTSITFADGDPGNPRVDLVVLRVYDNDQDASGQTAATIEIVPGRPAASPTPPPVPPGALALAQVTVPAGASAGTGGLDWKSAVVDRRRATVAVGGIVPLARGAAFNGAYPGQYRDTGSGLERWNGKDWKPYPEQPVWQDYTPKWGSATDGAPDPVLRGGSVEGRYIKTGPVVHFRAFLKIGLFDSWGGPGTNGNWYLTLPVKPARSSTGGFRARLGDENGGYFHGACEISPTLGGSARNWTSTKASGAPTTAWVDADDPMPPLGSVPAVGRPGGPAPASVSNWYEVWGTYEVTA